MLEFQGVADDLPDIEAGWSVSEFVRVKLLLDLYQMENW
jgi:hypothetical protein